MSVTQTGKLSNTTKLAALTASVTTLGDLYMGFTTDVITVTDTLATITESTHIARFKMDDKLGGSALDVNGIPTITNHTAITSGSSTASGQQLLSWFITAVPSASVGDIIAFGTGDPHYTNIGSTVVIEVGVCKIQMD